MYRAVFVYPGAARHRGHLHDRRRAVGRDLDRLRADHPHDHRRGLAHGDHLLRGRRLRGAHRQIQVTEVTDQYGTRDFPLNNIIFNLRFLSTFPFPNTK